MMNIIYSTTVITLTVAIASLMPATAFAASADDRPATYRQVAPILEEKCASCHGEEKQKAELRVDSLMAIIKGGKNGPVLKMGDPHGSTLYTLCNLPPDHEDIMPSKGDPLTEEELTIMYSWINGKMSVAKVRELRANAPQIRAERRAAAAAGGGGRSKGGPAPIEEDDPRAKSLPDIADSVIADLESNGVIIDTMTSDGRIVGITVHQKDRAALGTSLKLIQGISKHIISLDLSRSAVQDADLKMIANMPMLERLDVSSTSISDTSMAAASQLSGLRWINLSSSKVGDSGLKQLQNASALQECFVWNSSAKPAGIKALKNALPDCEIIE